MTYTKRSNAALEAKDPDKLLEIVQELNKVLKHEEQVRRDFREAARANKSSLEVRR
jgi:ribosomal protein L16 Arg81 hydroxylase